MPERALADPEQGDRDAAAAAPGSLERKELERAEELAKERGEQKSAEWGSQIRSYFLHPDQRVKDHRTNFEVGDTQRVLDGDLDGFVREYLNYAASTSGPRAAN